VKPSRIVIVGAGMVGSTTAYTLFLRGRANEIVLIDINREKAFGDALDMNHGHAFAGPTKVWAGDYADCEGAEIIIIAAGAAQKPGETRIDLLNRNAAIFGDIIANITRYTKDAILLVATNPVDIMSYVTLVKSGFPVRRVIGSGTLLDSARLRFLIGDRLKVDPRSVHAHIVGEHGDSEVPLWSLANFAGTPINLTPEEKEEIFINTRDAAYRIIEAKGATYYAIALALDRICAAILGDEGAVLNVSTLLDDYHGVSGIYLGVPCIVDRSGVREVIKVDMSEEEIRLFRASGDKIREQIRGLKLD